MRRRRVLAGLAGAGLLGGSFVIAQSGLPGSGAGDAREGEVAIEVETIDAPGSQAGTVTVPPTGAVSVVDLFATWCAPCREQMDELVAARERVDDARFVSVTNERVGQSLTRADVADWWRRHDGAWTVGLDPESDLLRAVGASGVPVTATFDAAGRLVDSHQGLTGADTVVADVNEARSG